MSSEVLDDRFVIYRRDRCFNSTSKVDGGGVLIGVRKHLESYRRLSLESLGEDLWVTIPYRCNNVQNNLNICAVYIPSPCSPLKLDNQLNGLTNALNTIICDDKQDTLIVGDFNLGDIVWTHSNRGGRLKPSELSPQNNYYRLLYDFIALHGIHQYNLVYNRDKKILDLVLSSIDNTKVTEAEPLSKVDTYHPPLLIELEIGTLSFLKKLDVPRYDFRKANYTLLNIDLNAVNWKNAIGHDEDVNVMLDKFYAILNNLIDKHVPKKKKLNHKYPVWYNCNLKKLIKEKYKLHARYKKHKNPLDYLYYSELRILCHKNIKICYNIYLKSIEDSICSHNIKAFWSFLKNKRKTIEAIPSTMYLNKDKLSSPQAICNGFAEYFASVYADDDNGNFDPIPPTYLACDYLSTIEITPQNIERAIFKLDINQGPGPDGLPAIFIKKTVKALVLPLYMIFVKSIDTAIFPDKWKLANVIPIPKGGNATDIEDYRPISLLSIMERVFEAVVSPTFTQMLDPIININQHGFLKNKSTNTNLACYISDLQEYIDQGLQVDAIYTDISKAFDRVNHKILLNKLSCIGVHGKLLKWFNSYLTNRSQKVVVAGYESSPFAAPSGVPQGSNLGPKLFLVFINDLADIIQSSHYSFFADDLKLYRPIRSSSDVILLQKDLSRVLQWSIVNKLPLNTKKCKYISFTKKKSPILASYGLDGKTLDKVTEIKDLGVTIDDRLTFNVHTNNIVKKSLAMLGFIWRNCREFRNLMKILLK
ncbi:hypothetical protein JYU34_009744 [Plutella xylostella]|uniref:Reverse transcriptase domain-containing protein n=1 Tax=Plutella xylostella TaxID=51655 RepID=A0ABQ7QLJ6_PLUXY|nr:hypothetical protein JYU34_009744 [Plutella xylostella]